MGCELCGVGKGGGDLMRGVFCIMSGSFVCCACLGFCILCGAVQNVCGVLYSGWELCTMCAGFV